MMGDARALEAFDWFCVRVKQKEWLWAWNLACFWGFLDDYPRRRFESERAWLKRIVREHQ